MEDVSDERRSADEAWVQDVLREAGSRPEVAAEVEPLRASVERAWRDALDARVPPGDRAISGERAPAGRPRRRARSPLSLLMAAALLSSLAAVGWLVWRRSAERPMEGVRVVARVERLVGPASRVLEEGAEERTQPLATADALPMGSSLVTGPVGLVALSWSTGHSVRLAPDGRLRISAERAMVLERGTLYVASGSSAGDLEVETPLGVVHELGTQFMVAVHGKDGVGREPRVTISVRNGVVELQRGGEAYRIAAGERVVARSGGEVERQSLGGADASWQWTQAVSPGFELEGRTLFELLEWVHGETGWKIQYADPRLEQVARSTTLHGRVENLSPLQTLNNVFPTTGLGYQLREGRAGIERLVVEPSPASGGATEPPVR